MGVGSDLIIFAASDTLGDDRESWVSGAPGIHSQEIPAHGGGQRDA